MEIHAGTMSVLCCGENDNIQCKLVVYLIVRQSLRVCWSVASVDKVITELRLEHLPQCRLERTDVHEVMKLSTNSVSDFAEGHHGEEDTPELWGRLIRSSFLQREDEVSVVRQKADLLGRLHESGTHAAYTQ